MIETDISLKPTPDLPVSNSSSFDIVAILNNKDTVRVGWESLTANYIKQTSDVPQVQGESSSSPYITFAADDTGLYVSDGSDWRKMATYGENWDDLKSSDTRFLPVNSTITLSEEERTNVFSSIQLGTATLDVAGLVKVSTDPEGTINIDTDGVLHVNLATPILEINPDGKPGIVYIKDFYDGFDENDSSDISSKCAVTERYVHQAIQNHNVDIPRATYTSAGIVQIDSNSALTVDDAGILNTVSATADTSGVVRLVKKDNESVPAAISVGFANSLVEAKAAEILSTKATSSQLGLVKVPGSSAVTVNSSGELDVRYATDTQHGVVMVVDELSPYGDYSEYTSATVSPGAVKEYVTYELDKVYEKFPVASTYNLGLVQIESGCAAGLQINEFGVLSTPTGAEKRLGSVLVIPGIMDPAPFTVPTLKKVIDMLPTPNTCPLADTGVDGVAKLGRNRDNPIISGAIPVGVNVSGQLCIDSSDIGKEKRATNSTYGVVRLSSGNTGLSATTTNNSGLPIGRGPDGAIYVDVSSASSLATVARYGLVKLSIDSTLPSSNPGIGVDANGRLRLATSSSTTESASYSLYDSGVSGYSSYAAEAANYSSSEAESSSYSTAVYSTPSSVDSDIVNAAGVAPFGVTLTKMLDSPVTYKVTMTGGVVQMNDGSLVNVEEVTDDDNFLITPEVGQTLKLQVYINDSGDPVARLRLVSDTKVLTCKPTLC